jgi:hypothetical protein
VAQPWHHLLRERYGKLRRQYMVEKIHPRRVDLEELLLQLLMVIAMVSGGLLLLMLVGGCNMMMLHCGKLIIIVTAPPLLFFLKEMQCALLPLLRVARGNLSFLVQLLSVCRLQ